MTIQPMEESQSLSLWQGNTGLEDFGVEDISMPRLVIDHDDCVYKDSQTEQTFSSLETIIFGIHKGRIMWGEISDSDNANPPLCKSTDFKHGFPNMDPEAGKMQQFPWNAQTVYKPEDAKAIQLADGNFSLPSLDCEPCHFRKWNTDPTGKRPWCGEVITFPLVYKIIENGEEVWMPALFSVKRSGLKNAKNYVTPFATRKTPMFTVVTTLGLQQNKRGKVTFGVPTFSKTGETDQGDWPMYHEQFLSAYTFLSQMPQLREVDSDTIKDNDIQDAEVVTEDPTVPVVEPEPEPEQKPVSTAGKIRPREPQAPTPPPSTPSSPQVAGSMQIGDDEEPPF